MSMPVKCSYCGKMVEDVCANCWRCTKCCKCDKKYGRIDGKITNSRQTM